MKHLWCTLPESFHTCLPAAESAPSMCRILCIASVSSWFFTSFVTLSLGAMSPTIAATQCSVKGLNMHSAKLLFHWLACLPSATSCTIASLMHLQATGMIALMEVSTLLTKRGFAIPIAVNIAASADKCHYAHSVHMVCNALRTKHSLSNPACPLCFLQISACCSCDFTMYICLFSCLEHVTTLRFCSKVRKSIACAGDGCASAIELAAG